jgi:RNA polymerase sigma-70 factor (ECF subfamily)
MPSNVYKKGDIETLINLAQNRDSKAIETLIRAEQRHIYAIFSHLADKKEDVADLTQEALIKMIKNIGTLKNPSLFRQWLNRIISNIFYDYVRKNSFSKTEVADDKINEIKDKLGCEPGEKCIFSEIERLIRTALMTLPKNLRLALILREYEGLSYEDISKITNTTLGTVKSRISRARLRLKEELADFI